MSNYHDCIVALHRKQLDAEPNHLVLSKDNLVVNELINPVRHGELDLMQTQLVDFVLHESVSLLECVQYTLMQPLAISDELGGIVPVLLELNQIRSRQRRSLFWLVGHTRLFRYAIVMGAGSISCSIAHDIVIEEILQGTERGYTDLVGALDRVLLHVENQLEDFGVDFSPRVIVHILCLCTA